MLCATLISAAPPSNIQNAIIKTGAIGGRARPTLPAAAATSLALPSEIRRLKHALPFDIL